jgi:hypothetical protein
MDHGAVDRQLAAIDSTIAEAHLLARIHADGPGFDRTTSARATELVDAFTRDTDVLGTARLPRDRARAAARATDLANETSAVVERWIAHPPSAGTAKHDDRQIRRLQRAMGKVAP